MRLPDRGTSMRKGPEAREMLHDGEIPGVSAARMEGVCWRGVRDMEELSKARGQTPKGLISFVKSELLP